MIFKVAARFSVKVQALIYLTFSAKPQFPHLEDVRQGEVVPGSKLCPKDAQKFHAETQGVNEDRAGESQDAWPHCSWPEQGHLHLSCSGCPVTFHLKKGFCGFIKFVYHWIRQSKGCINSKLLGVCIRSMENLPSLAVSFTVSLTEPQVPLGALTFVRSCFLWMMGTLRPLFTLG